MHFPGGSVSTFLRLPVLQTPKGSSVFNVKFQQGPWRNIPQRVFWICFMRDWIKMKMVLNKSPLGQNAPPALLYIHHFLVASYKSVIFKKKKLFVCLFFFYNKHVFLGVCQHNSATCSLPIPEFPSYTPKHLTLQHPLLFSQKA